MALISLLKDPTDSSTLLTFHYIYDAKWTLTYQMTQQACLQTELLHIQQDWNGYRAFQVLTTHQCWNEPGPIKKDTFRE